MELHHVLVGLRILQNEVRRALDENRPLPDHLDSLLQEVVQDLERIKSLNGAQ
jgi:hypothetical protein